MTRTAYKEREPAFNPLDYKGSLIATLKFYNSEIDDDVKKEWTLEYWKSQGKSVAYFDKINGASFAQLGVLVRIMNRGYDIDPVHKQFIEDEYSKLLSRVKKPKEQEKPHEKVVVVIDKTSQIVQDLCADIDAEYDQLSEFGVKKYDIKTQLSRVKKLHLISPILISRYTPKLEELKLALDGGDKQIKEGYSQYSKKTLKLMVDFTQSIIDVCSSSEPIKRTRKTKPISIEKLVSKVKYLKEYPALQFTSVSPENLVGAKVVYLFNVKVRKLIRYEVTPGEKLSVKVSTLIGYDVTKSCAKTIRKPEEFFQGINAMPQRNLDRKFSDVASVRAKVNGKLSEDCIILKVF